MPKYHNIVFINYYEDEELARLLSDGSDSELLEYLKQWDYGQENDHTPQDKPSHGTSDDVYQEGDYILSYNIGLGYAGLDRITED